MNLELLLARVQEIEAAIINTTNQLNALAGHKTEAMHWLTEFQKAAELDNSNPVESPLENPEDLPVE